MRLCWTRTMYLVSSQSREAFTCAPMYFASDPALTKEVTRRLMVVPYRLGSHACLGDGHRHVYHQQGAGSASMQIQHSVSLNRKSLTEPRALRSLHATPLLPAGRSSHSYRTSVSPSMLASNNEPWSTNGHLTHNFLCHHSTRPSGSMAI